MDMRHEFTVPIGVEEAWETFNDLERIAPCFPGAQIISVDGDDFTGLAKIKLGPVSLQYTGTGHWNERDASNHKAVIEASGKDKRGNGTAAAVITARLVENGGSSTKVVVETDLKITGRPAQFGRGVIHDVGGKLLDQFAACLATTLGEEKAEPPAPVPTGGSRPPDAAAAPAASTPVAAAAPVARTAPAGPVLAPPPPRSPVPVPRDVALDLWAVVLPTLLQKVGPTALACLVTAVVTWLVARRRG